jgi:hypothetical protein
MRAHLLSSLSYLCLLIGYIGPFDDRPSKVRFCGLGKGGVFYNGEYLSLMALSETNGCYRLLSMGRVKTPYSDTVIIRRRSEYGRIRW